MESTVFFEKKVSISSRELNEVKRMSLDDIILKKVTGMVEKKCSEDGYILPGSVNVMSRSIGYFEAARFTGDANYYVKLKCNVLYPVDGAQLVGKVERKNKMGLYVNYKDAIHIQVPRDLHIGNPAYEEVEIGDTVLLELKRSRFTINDPFILSSGKFISRDSMGPLSNPAKPVAKPDAKPDAEEEDVQELPQAEAALAALSPIPEGNEANPVEPEADVIAPVVDIEVPAMAPAVEVEAPALEVEAPALEVEAPVVEVAVPAVVPANNVANNAAKKSGLKKISSLKKSAAANQA
jgi:hypothetical protein